MIVRFRLAKTFGFLAAAVILSTRIAASDDVGPDDAVSRAIPYLESEGVRWIKQRGCVSCHQVPLMLWSLSAAEQHGYSVDSKALSRWQSWSTEAKNFVKPDQKESVVPDDAMASNIDTMSALMLAIPTEPETEKKKETKGWRVTFAKSLVTNQKPDGSWRSCGQLPMQKRDPDETTRVTGLWTLLALSTVSNDPTLDTDDAMNVIDSGDANESTEWWAARLLLEQQTGGNQIEHFAGELIERQNEDGGWGWLTGESSDALGTGMAIYALSRTEATLKTGKITAGKISRAIDRAVSRLIADQENDGSWLVPGTKKTTRNKTPPTAVYWGTAWAVVGLVESQRLGS